MTLDELSLTTPLIAPSRAVDHLNPFVVPDDRVGKTQNGLSTRSLDSHLKDGEFVRMTTEDDELLAVGVFVADESVVQPKVVLS